MGNEVDPEIQSLAGKLSTEGFLLAQTSDGQWQLPVKLTYVGPPEAGKLTNLEAIRQGTEGEPPIVESPLSPKVHSLSFVAPGLKLFSGRVEVLVMLYTAPGSLMFAPSDPNDWNPGDRDGVHTAMIGTRGLIFVADSTPEQHELNVATMLWLEDYEQERGSLPPTVLQFNKRDLPDALPLSVLEQDLDPGARFDKFEAVATAGEGVFGPMRAAIKPVLQRAIAAARK